MAIMTPRARRAAPTAPHVSTRRVRDDLWRVSSTTGIALGYVARLEGPAGPSFEARRLVPGSTALLPIGGGWSVEDALACFTGP